MKPHKSQYYLKSGDKEKDPVKFEQDVKKICQTYFDAAENERNGVHTISVDEKTGIQALEREAPTKPMIPGHVEKREYNYERHGTTCLFGHLNVGTGEIVAPMLNPTRTEEDFTTSIENIIETDPDAGWIFVADNLNTHVSVSLVILIAMLLGIPCESLGKKRKYGILKSMKTRRAFLEDETHRIRFVYTPLHCSWMNQIEIWFSGLVRRVLNRGSFVSVTELNGKILEYITFYNATAKPMNWKYNGNNPDNTKITNTI